MSRIFISYSSEDKPRVKRLADALRKQDLTVWWDKDILAGQKWREVIQEQLDSADYVIVAWSKLSIESDFVKEEARSGASRGVLIPVLLDDVDPPLGFGQIESATLVEWTGDPRHSEFQNLVSSISTPHRIDGLWGGEGKETYVANGAGPLNFTIRLTLQLKADGVLGEAVIRPRPANPELPDKILLKVSGKMRGEWVQLVYDNPESAVVQMGIIILRFKNYARELVGHYGGFSQARETFVAGELAIVKQERS